MNWIREHKRSFRLIWLVLLVIAIGAPWAYDRVSVPAQYACSSPNFRLDENFCGSPLSIAWFLFAAVVQLFYREGGLATGEFRFASIVAQLRAILFVFLLIFPVVSTAVLVLRGGGRRWQRLHGIGLGLAASITGLLAGMGYFTAGWVAWRLWGTWLYIFLTTSLFVLEVFVLRTPPGFAKDSAPERTAAA